MFEFGKSLSASGWNQSHQKNPILWEMLYREGDKFTPQSPPIRCKDYFNDVVSAYNGGLMQPIYGFDVSKVKLQPEGQWIRLFNTTGEKFLDQVQSIIFPVLKEQMGADASLTPLDDGTALLFIPREVFNQTYRVSALTQMIRACNYDTPTMTTWEQVCSNVDNTEGRDPTRLLKWRLLPPEKYQEFWWYFNDQYHSKAKNPDCGMHNIHNNGYLYFLYGAPV